MEHVERFRVEYEKVKRALVFSMEREEVQLSRVRELTEQLAAAKEQHETRSALVDTLEKQVHRLDTERARAVRAEVFALEREASAKECIGELRKQLRVLGDRVKNLPASSTSTSSAALALGDSAEMKEDEEQQQQQQQQQQRQRLQPRQQAKPRKSFPRSLAQRQRRERADRADRGERTERAERAEREKHAPQLDRPWPQHTHGSPEFRMTQQRNRLGRVDADGSPFHEWRKVHGVWAPSDSVSSKPLRGVAAAQRSFDDPPATQSPSRRPRTAYELYVATQPAHAHEIALASPARVERVAPLSPMQRAIKALEQLG
jgi:hypothetical protein